MKVLHRDLFPDVVWESSAILFVPELPPGIFGGSLFSLTSFPTLPVLANAFPHSLSSPRDLVLGSFFEADVPHTTWG